MPALMGLLLLPEGLSAFLEIAGLGRSKCCRGLRGELARRFSWTIQLIAILLASSQ